MTTQVLHRTFDKAVETSGDAIYFLADSKGTTKLTGASFKKWAASLGPNSTVRLTNAAMFMPIRNLADTTGAKFVSCHWHKTGLGKGLEAEIIATAFLPLPDAIFSPVNVREELVKLKTMVQMRYAQIDYRRAWQLKLSAITRGLGLSDNEVANPEYAYIFDRELANIKAMQKENESPLDKDIAKHAATIPECVLLNQIMGIGSSWTTSASVVAYLGDMGRFDSVSALWKYSGYDVVAGKAPKRAKGQVQTWNGKLRTSLWLWADSMLKTKNPIWRPVYDTYRAQELAVHASKCPCKTIEGHSGARARRRVIKDVLKAFFAATHQATAIVKPICAVPVVAAKETPTVIACVSPVVKKKRAARLPVKKAAA